MFQGAVPLLSVNIARLVSATPRPQELKTMEGKKKQKNILQHLEMTMFDNGIGS